MNVYTASNETKFKERRIYRSLKFVHSFHSTATCRMRLFLAILRSLFHSSLLCTVSFHTLPPTSLPSSLTSSCHLLLGLLLSSLFPNSYLILLGGIIFSSIPLCYVPFPSTLFHQLVFHPPSPHLAIYFLVYPSALCFQIHI